jgi:CRP-like cAMP-binding protein
MTRAKPAGADRSVANAAVLSRTVLFRNLKPAKLRELARLAHERSLDRGETLFIAGEQASGIYAIASGSIRAFRTNAQGRQQTLHIEFAGATLAEVPTFDDGPYPATAVAEEPSVVLFLAKRDILAFMYRNPEIALGALKVLAGRLRQHAAVVDALALQEVGQRLARVLLLQARAAGRRSSTGLQLELALSNQQLADRVGSVREVISRTLGRLEQNGLIVLHRAHPQKKTRTLIIPDPAALATYSGEDLFSAP